MSTKRTNPASERAASLGLLSKTSTAEQDVEAVASLGAWSHKEYPNTPVFLPPMLVGYDTASNRNQWEVTYASALGGHWALGKLGLYSEWHIPAFGKNTAGETHTHRLGVFATESEPWVGKPAGMWAHQEWHAWGACLYPDPGTSGGGKILVFFDSNVKTIMQSDGWTKDVPDSENDLEPKQKSLLSYLRVKRAASITQVWLGGEGNTARGLCLPLTYDWCKRVLQLQGLPTAADELAGLGFYRLTGKTGARGKLPRDKKLYVKKGDGGDGRGGMSGGARGLGGYPLRSRERA